MNKSRLNSLYSVMKEKKAPLLIISKPENIRYLSGFTGMDALLVVTEQEKFLVTDQRYTEQASTEAPLYKIVKQEDGLWKKTIEVLTKLLKQLNTKKIAFEGKYISYSVYALLWETFKGAEFINLSLDSLREVKDEEEISCIKKACAIADLAFDEVLKYLRPGLKEYEVAAFLENVMRKNGSERPAFDTIVASGIRGSLPHGIATEKLIISGEFVTMDFGAVHNGYSSDITRTVAVGAVDDEMRQVYETVLKAQMTALPYIKTGESGKKPNEIAKKTLGEYDKYFLHSLGHGVGLEIHENPRLSKTSECAALQQNMIVTDEPGIYIEGRFGVRIEDTVLVTDKGGEPLTKSDKSLIEILEV
ncbi:MAG: aminopeptidase P family protein [Selenomonadaceae bacterium]|nr:aminopeptidase P family protein [Selenomonadaceae bacterium]